MNRPPRFIIISFDPLHTFAQPTKTSPASARRELQAVRMTQAYAEASDSYRLVRVSYPHPLASTEPMDMLVFPDGTQEPDSGTFPDTAPIFDAKSPNPSVSASVDVDQPYSILAYLKKNADPHHGIAKTVTLTPTSSREPLRLAATHSDGSAIDALPMPIRT